MISPNETALAADIKASNTALPDPDITITAHALHSKGWSRPDEVEVHTPEELDELPVGSVIRMIGDTTIRPVWQRVTRTFYCWSVIGGEGRQTSETVMHASRGAVLIYSP